MATDQISHPHLANLKANLMTDPSSFSQNPPTASPPSVSQNPLSSNLSHVPSTAVLGGLVCTAVLGLVCGLRHAWTTITSAVPFVMPPDRLPARMQPAVGRTVRSERVATKDMDEVFEL